MDEDIREFGMGIGNKALERDWARVYELVAPWLQKEITVDGVREFFEDEYRKTLDANEIEETPYPEYPEPELDGNAFMNATELRKPISWEGDRVRNIAVEVTDDIVRYWLKIGLMSSDEQMDKLGFDCFAEVWVLVVETEDGLRVGYWSHGAS